MVIEFETCVLNVDAGDIISKLKALGAKEHAEVLMKRWVFEIDSEEKEWIRLRDDGAKVTVTYKNKKGSGISETEEVEVEVEDFKKTYEILSKFEFKGRYYQESKRRLFLLEGIEFSIDTWPYIPEYLEIEAESEEKVKKGLELLGLEGKDAGNLSVVDIYGRYGKDLHSFEKLKF